MGGGQIRIVSALGALLFVVGLLVTSVQGTGFTTVTKIVTLSGLGLLLVSGILAISSIVAMLRTRQGRYGVNVLTGTLALLGILVIVNFLGTRYFKRADVTSSAQFSLASQTERILARVDRDVTLYNLVPSEQSGVMVYVEDLVTEYDVASTRVRVKRVDPSRDPGAVERLGVRRNQWLVVECGERMERLAYDDITEESITNAILRALDPDRKTLYVLTGHGERSITDEESAGYAQAAAQLTEQNFALATLRLTEVAGIPEDATVLLMLSPQTPYFPEEVAMLADYLDRGRNLLVCVDPVASDGRAVDLGLDELLATYGVRLGTGAVYDDTPFARQRGVGYYKPVAVSPNTDSPITEGFSTLFTVFPTVRPVWREGGLGDAVVLAHTAKGTWEERDYLVAEGPPVFDEARDRHGPVPVAYAIEAAARTRAPLDPLSDPDAKLVVPDTRLVVIGDSDFAANANIAITQVANRDLFLNTIAWLAEEDDIIAVRPRSVKERRLRLTAVTRNVIRMTSLVGLPVGVVIAGVLVWIGRRKRDV